MVDVLTPEQRHRNMSRIRGKNTKPELIVRRFLFSRGYHYRLHVRELPGTPDIVFRKYHTAVFINGCFWHGHVGCKYSVVPKTRSEWWKKKIIRNRERDIQELSELADMGWHTFVIWECQLKPHTRQKTLDDLEESLCRIANKQKATQHKEKI